ncbi:MAG: DUF1624 domain-containing protein [Gemmatimonadetes bacterium]|nr:DUF1624 domain-containing protein [Gemmatimonadota bacterium]
MPVEDRPRLAALDWMRGLAMILMTVDHASGAFNAGRLFTDSALFWEPGTPLPPDQFFTRWITHICAPTFVFLAGAALALSAEKRLSAGTPAGVVDRQIVGRGLLIAALDPLLISPIWNPGGVLLQVLYAIGLGLVCMAVLRRLGQRWLLGIGVGLLVFGDALAGFALTLPPGAPRMAGGLLISGGFFGRLIAGYPLLPWLAMMMLGWSFGRFLLSRHPQGAARAAPARVLVLWGMTGLAVFLATRGLNGYGNMLVPRDDGSLVQWLHVSKYPPSLSFAGLELGLMAICLAGFFRLAARTTSWPGSKLLLVLGQTALFFYVLHIPLLELGARALGLWHARGLAATYVATVVTVALLYPLCVLYRTYKAGRPGGWTRYL